LRRWQNVIQKKEIWKNKAVRFEESIHLVYIADVSKLLKSCYEKLVSFRKVLQSDQLTLISELYIDINVEDVYGDYGEKVQKEINMLCILFPKLTNLQILRLNFPDAYDEESGVKYEWKMPKLRELHTNLAEHLTGGVYQDFEDDQSIDICAPILQHAPMLEVFDYWSGDVRGQFGYMTESCWRRMPASLKCVSLRSFKHAIDNQFETLASRAPNLDTLIVDSMTFDELKELLPECLEKIPQISRLIWIEDMSFIAGMTQAMVMREINDSLKPLLTDKRPDWKMWFYVFGFSDRCAIFADNPSSSILEFANCNYKLISNEKSSYWNFSMEEKYSDVDWDKVWESAE